MITEKLVLENGTETSYNEVQRRLINIINSDANLIILPLTARRSGTTTLMYNVAAHHMLSAFFHYKTYGERKHVVIASRSVDSAMRHRKNIMDMLRTVFKGHWSGEDFNIINRLVLFSPTGHYGLKITNAVFFDMPATDSKAVSDYMHQITSSFSNDVKILINVVQ